MADPATTGHPRLRHLVGGWLFSAGSIVVFAWLTAGAYVHQMLQPLPGEADLAERECRAISSCAPDAGELVKQQLSLLRHTKTLVYASAWSVPLLATITIAAATLLMLRERRDTLARFLGLAGKLQTAWATVLLVAQGVVLGIGASTLAGTSEAARMFTTIKAFDSPFTDAGNLYYLAWFIAVSVTAASLTRSHRRSL